MSRQRESLLLARRSYRRRRLEDAARLIPLLGVFFFLLPLLAPAAHPAQQGGALFFGWLGLIALSAIVSRGLKRWPDLWRDPNIPTDMDGDDRAGSGGDHAQL